MTRPTEAELNALDITPGEAAEINAIAPPLLAGAGALRYAVVYDQLGTFVILATWGLAVIAVFGGGERPTVAGVARRIVSFPPFIALVVALAVFPAEPPAAVTEALRMLTSALLPLVVLALGMQLRLRLPREHLLPLAIGLLAKLVLMPLLGPWGIFAADFFGVVKDATFGFRIGDITISLTTILIAFAMTLQHSLQWVIARPAVAIAFGMIGGPLAYWGASRGFDAVAFTMPLQATLTLAIGWGIAMGVLTAIARRRHTSIAHQSGASA